MNAPAETRRQAQAGLTAIGLVLLSSLLYVVGYGLSKALVTTYGLTPLQVTFLRCALVLAAGCGAAAWPHSRLTWRRILNPARAWEQRAASAAVVCSIYLSVLAYGLMPVTDASALGFMTPLLLTALAGLVLRERVSLNRWLGAAVGFGGMLFIVRPGAGVVPIGLAASVGSALAYAFYQVFIRRLRDVATSFDSVIQVALAGFVLLAGAMAVSWHPISLAAFGVAAAATAVQTAGLVCIVAALRRGEASQLAPWQFSGLLWAVLLDVVAFALPPSIGSLVGCALILAGGFLAHAGGRKAASPAPDCKSGQPALRE